jgi:hypothetical protein
MNNVRTNSHVAIAFSIFLIYKIYNNFGKINRKSMKIVLIIFIILSVRVSLFSQDILTPFEKDSLTTTTYSKCISFYKQLAAQNDMVRVIECGQTDIGKPLHLVIVSKDKIFDPEEIRKSGKVILMINNGIHPGEPDGIDASMMLVRNLISGNSSLLNHVVLITIPIYNIDGALNRNNFTRVNQIGPLEYGFRGNYENRDLNRDFIKCDTKNARSFVEIFRKWKPELFTDTHTTDGADYIYAMTYIATHHNKLELVLANYMTGTMIPFMETEMKNAGQEMCPYVDTYKSTPDSGLVGFLETPRYSSGYASLFNSIGFISESHMLKTHSRRVKASYEFLLSLLKIANRDYKTIIENKKKADENTINKSEFVLTWKPDESNFSKYLFKGYEAKYKPSVISGFSRLYYDKNTPYEKGINFYNEYKPVVTVTKPEAYIIPQAWWQVIDLLNLNGVKTERLTEDKTIDVESYYIDKFDTQNPPFEGHYLHSNVEVRKVNRQRKFFAGDYIVCTNQDCNNFIMHVLEPQSTDSYFCWNFFDAILQQKEYFENYTFEDIADSLLNSKPGLKQLFEDKKNSDEKFRNDTDAQLAFIYNNTILEPEYMQYPVARVLHSPF